MAFWSPARVADDLRLDRLTEKAKARYVVAGTVLHGLAGSSSVLGVRTMGELLTAVLGLCVILLGVRACLLANTQGDGRAFVERYVCLGVPLFLWMYGVYVGAYYLGFVVLRISGSATATSYQALASSYASVAGVVWLVGFFVALRHYIRQAAGVRASTGQPA